MVSTHHKLLSSERIVESLLTEAVGIFYHVTWLKNIPGIKSGGLVPQGSGEFTFDQFSDWSRGRVFFANYEDMLHWIALVASRGERELAYQDQYRPNPNKPNPNQRRYLPVVLRFPYSGSVAIDGVISPYEETGQSYYKEPESRVFIPANKIHMWVPNTMRWIKLSSVTPTILNSYGGIFPGGYPTQW
jgi:hypothetical protein